MRALWSDRQNCSQNVSQKVKRIRRLSDQRYSLFCGRGWWKRGPVCPPALAFGRYGIHSPIRFASPTPSSLDFPATCARIYTIPAVITTLGNGGILFREYCFGEENSLSVTEFWGKLTGEFWEKLSEFGLAHYNRLRGTH